MDKIKDMDHIGISAIILPAIVDDIQNIKWHALLSFAALEDIWH